VAVFDLLLFVLFLMPAALFVWFFAGGNYGTAGFPLAVGLMLYGLPIGERLVRALAKTQRAATVVIISWLACLSAVGAIYLGWTQGLPFGEWTLPKPVPKTYAKNP
jgi:uncharacterized membrane protein